MNDAPAIGAILLAAGESQRFGDENKLLASFAGEALIRHAARTVSTFPFAQRLIVTGADAVDVKSQIAEFPLQTAHNPDYRSGMGSSISAGARALAESLEAVVILLGDMPFIDGGRLTALADGYSEPGDICVTSHGGDPGPPVLFGRAYFGELRALAGTEGAKSLLRRHHGLVKTMGDAGDESLADIDTRSDLAAYTANLTPKRVS